MLLLDARHGFKKLDMEFLEQLYDPKGPSPLGEEIQASHLVSYSSDAKL